MKVVMVLCKLCENLREYIISLDFKKVCACFFVNLRILSSFFSAYSSGKYSVFPLQNDVLF